MSSINVFCLLAIAFTLVVVLEALPQKFENLDVDGTLNDKVRRDRFFKCLLDKGPCTPEESDLKANARKNLETTCAGCTAKQKEVVRKSSKYVMENNPEEWHKLVNVYDPDKKYIEPFIKFINRDD